MGGAQTLSSAATVTTQSCQGGAIALLSLRSATKLAGVIGLSTYLPLRAEQPVLSDANKQTPVLMCHGSADMVVSPLARAAWRLSVTSSRAWRRSAFVSWLAC